MMKKFLMAAAVGALALTGTASGVMAKTLKVQASSKSGDWAHRFMTDKWAPKLDMMTGGDIKIDVLPTKAVVPHRETIACGDVAVFPGDVIVGDGEAVIVIPLHLVDEIAEEATQMTAFEDFVTEQVNDGAAIIGLYPATKDETKAAFAKWRAKTGR